MFSHLARCFLLLNVLPIPGNMLGSKIEATLLFLVTRLPMRISGGDIKWQFLHWLKNSWISSILPYKEHLLELHWSIYSATLGWKERLWQNNNSKLTASNILTELKLSKLWDRRIRVKITSLKKLTRGQEGPTEKLRSTTNGTTVTQSKNFQRHKPSQ